MGFRIDKSWASIAPVTPAKRKEQADAITALNDRNGHGNPNKQQQEKQKDETPEEPTRDELEKAISEMKALPVFTNTGIHADIVTTKNGTVVRMSQANGVFVREMSAIEFMKLHSISSNAEQNRGSILDRKY